MEFPWEFPGSRWTRGDRATAGRVARVPMSRKSRNQERGRRFERSTVPAHARHKKAPDNAEAFTLLI
jgi:hypothetical protein